MPLTLILGPANSAKAGEVLGAYADAAPRGALLVVPTASDAGHYSWELAEQGCVLRSVLTFAGLIEQIAQRAGYHERRLSRLQREWILRRMLAGRSFSTLGAVAGTPGFLATAGELISELQRSMVSAPRFAAALRAWAAEDPRRAPYAEDLAAIYSGHVAELERSGGVDRDLFAWRALDALRLAPGRWGEDRVFLYGFDDLHELQRDTVETLARIVGVEVTVSLTYEAARPALSARSELVAELRQLAHRVVELPARADYYLPGSRQALHHLERSLFEPSKGAQRVAPGAAVRLLEAGGELAEAELVAAEIRGLLDAGLPGEEIAVVRRRLDAPALAAMSSALRRCDVNAEVPHRDTLGQTALGHGLLGLARCALLEPEQSSARDLLDYLRTPGLLRREEVVDDLEVKVRCRALRTVAEAREALSFELGEIDRLAGAADPLRELAWQARRLLAAPFRGRAALLNDQQRLDAAAAAAVMRCASELEELSEVPAGRDLVELLEGLEVSPTGPSDPHAVVVSDPFAIRARRFRVVFVCGLQEGAFPMTPAPDPFLSDEVRRELAMASGLRLRRREDALDRERYLFYACVSRATEQVVLSYRSSDEEGNLALASPFIEDVAEVLAPQWRQERRRRLLADVVWQVDEAPTERERERALAAATANELPAAAAPAPARLGPAALARVRHARMVSAGALESYAECHMKWLVERELQPAALEPTPEPLARGSYIHDVLERILARLGAPLTPETLPEAIALLEEAMLNVPPEIAAGRPSAIRRAVAAMIAADLRRYLEYEAAAANAWEPRALELRFGFNDEEESLPPLVLGDGGEPVSVRGAIDRVDVEPGTRRALVRDYKSGSARIDYQGSRWRGDQRLQVALYMVAVRQLLGLEPVAGLYQPLGGRDLRPRGIYLEGTEIQSGLFPRDGRDAEALESELEDACRRAVALAGALRAGELEPSPDTCSRDGCRYPGICRAQ